MSSNNDGDVQVQGIVAITLLLAFIIAVNFFGDTEEEKAAKRMQLLANGTYIQMHEQEH